MRKEVHALPEIVTLRSRAMAIKVIAVMLRTPSERGCNRLPAV